MVPKSKLIDTKLADEDYCYITTVGRVTGKPHTVEIWFGTNGDTIYVLAGSGHDADFVKNAKKQTAVDVRIATTMFAGTARIVTETREDTLARELLMKKYVKASTSDLVEWGRDALPVAFDLVAP
jgi:deazaflavin-dependent oxidoreductase (nitroreductase family)